MVAEVGIEPTKPYGRQILSLLCLPISPHGLKGGQLVHHRLSGLATPSVSLGTG